MEANSTTILPFFWPRSTFTRVSKRSESRPARSVQRRGDPVPARGPLASPRSWARRPQRDDLLDRPHRKPLGDDAVGEPVLLLGVVHGQQRPRVPGGEHPGRHPPLHRRREPQQPQRVGHLRTRAPDPVGQLVVGAVEVLQQLVVRRRLFQRVQLRPVQVLQQRVQQQLFVVGRPDDRGDPLQTGLTARPPAALAHDQLIALRPDLPYDDRLEQADLLDGGDQFRERVLVEDLTRLPGVGGDRVQRHLREVRARRRLRPA